MPRTRPTPVAQTADPPAAPTRGGHDSAPRAPAPPDPAPPDPAPLAPWAAADLRVVVATGLERGGALLTAGERVVARRMLALPDEAAELYARLLARKGPVFRVATLGYALDVGAALGRLAEDGLVHTTLPPDRCRDAFDLDALRAACRRLGLPTRGRREEVVARLAGQPWLDEAVVSPGHAALVRRLELFTFERASLDRSVFVLERLGNLRWAEYTPTGGPGLFADRAALRLWERARAGEWWSEEEPLAVALRALREREPVLTPRGSAAEELANLRASEASDVERERAGPGGHAPVGERVAVGALSPLRYALEAVLAGGPSAAVLTALDEAGAAVAVELVRALEAEGRVEEAWARCRRGDPDPATRLALARTGARLARALRRSWPPGEPLREAPRRRLRLRRVPAAPRPLWAPLEAAEAGTARVPPPPPHGAAAEESAPIATREGSRPRPAAPTPSEPTTVELAALRLLHAAGREAAHTENGLWTTLYALCLREAYWLPVPGALPTPRRHGPLDVGTPTFYTRRREVVDRLLGRVAAEGVSGFVAAWQGESLAGLARPELARAWAARLDGAMVGAVLRRLAAEGWAAASGLPDLLVLADAGGGAGRVPGLLPPSLPAGSFLVEVKGEGDSLRDGQRVWMDRLLAEGICVELWEVAPDHRG